MDYMGKTRVLSGIRASHSSLHLGNLLGAIRGMVRLQNDPQYETYYMVADLHGVTTPFDPEEMRKNRLSVAMDFLAAGIDPNKTVLFFQSSVPEHTELAYLLSTVISVNRLLDLPSYKDKKKQFKGYPATHALLSYPVLMAADILLYKAKLVPIAEDQYPHLEITRDIAKKMNQKFGLDFPLPEHFSELDPEMMVPSVLGSGKMSKSKEGSSIFLNDSEEDIKKKIAGMPTDSGKGTKVPKKEDSVFSLFQMVEIVLGKEKRLTLENQYLTTGVKYSEVKKELSNKIFEIINPIQKRRADLEKNPQEVERILDSGAKKAREVAKQTLFEVKEAMGLSSR